MFSDLISVMYTDDAQYRCFFLCSFDCAKLKSVLSFKLHDVHAYSLDQPSLFQRIGLRTEALYAPIING